ncbi:uncharacterized protein LOC132698652 [Cylas formicarius]|uniref:uncharacterized protein LOC132698652 n=1 Tax=Cylas formicarius TaxID=197179 RepID=UPI00295879F8|nr:uncharacterized protein LOC132698652 [Cylas formicarius]
MHTLEVFLLLIVAASASLSPDLHPLSDEYIARINSIQTTWEAAKNFHIEDWDRVKKIASGTWKTPDSIKRVDKVDDASESVPESFDARDAWPECVEFIGQIRDQSACGACWAFAAAEAMSDRLCIHSNGTVRKYISAEDLSSCCDYCGDGCNGGIPYNAWAYWEDSGIVSGGLYQSNQGCKDFSLAPCEHHSGTDSKVSCEDLTGYNTPECVRSCYDTSIDYESDLTYGQEPIFLWDEKQIQLEIYKNGPVEAGFTVFEDFLSYKSGIYQPTTEKMVGGHAVKIIGWGEEDGVKYWLIVNSWNSDWGTDGYVKFIRGEDSCGIESEVTAALPRVYKKQRKLDALRPNTGEHQCHVKTIRHFYWFHLQMPRSSPNMKYLGAVLLLVATASATPVANLHPLSDEYIAHINSIQNTWKAGKTFDVEEWDRVKRIASGAWKKPVSVQLDRNVHDESRDIPESFDSREAWPQCAEFIGQIRDQSSCGACWAFAAAEAMSDRICIHSNGTVRKHVSSEDLNSCCLYCGDGCDGGYPYEAWYYWQKTGIVTGGLYESNQGCKDYSLEPCEHHTTGNRVACSELEFNTPRCVKSCYDSSIDYQQDLTFGQTVREFTNEKQIQLEILSNGPVEAGFTVYEDFLTYKSGVYQPTTRNVVGGHAVKIIGWGVEKGVKYWLIANSWNTDWGTDGYVKFIRGVDSGGLESEVVASLPKF